MYGASGMLLSDILNLTDKDTLTFLWCLVTRAVAIACECKAVLDCVHCSVGLVNLTTPTVARRARLVACLVKKAQHTHCNMLKWLYFRWLYLLGATKQSKAG